MFFAPIINLCQNDVTLDLSNFGKIFYYKRLRELIVWRREENLDKKSSIEDYLILK